MWQPGCGGLKCSTSGASSVCVVTCPRGVLSHVACPMSPSKRRPFAFCPLTERLKKNRRSAGEAAYHQPETSLKAPKICEMAKALLVLIGEFEQSLICLISAAVGAPRPKQNVAQTACHKRGRGETGHKRGGWGQNLRGDGATTQPRYKIMNPERRNVNKFAKG